ncbi:MAG: hypothetical protein LBJ16_01005 [Holosporaceae bacterium]|nr:hypothetical protein [Holosporaceae bacterium]
MYFGILNTSYGARDASIGVAKNGICRFLATNPVINPTHCVSLDDSSLLKLSLAVGKFCNMRSALQEFSGLISEHYRKEKDVDRLQMWLSAIGVLAGGRGGEDTPSAFVLQVQSTAPFSQSDVLDKFSNILGKIGNFQYSQHFLKQILKIDTVNSEYRKVFAEWANLNLASLLNPILSANKVELEHLVELARAEKEKALLRKIGYIVGHYGLDPTTSTIETRAADMLEMDVLQRHKVVTEIYERKFLPFKEFLAVED